MERRTTLPRYGTRTSSLLLDAFTKVKKAIDDIVAQLLKEKEDEIKHKDFRDAGANEACRCMEEKD